MKYRIFFLRKDGKHRLNMELDLKSLFGLLCTVQLYSLAETPQLPPFTAFRLIYEDAIGQPIG